MARNGLEAWQDATLQPDSITPEEVAREEAERLYSLREMAIKASVIPRRLGGEATGQDLSKDKRISRKVAHTAEVLQGWWGTSDPVDWEDPAKDSAQLVWSEWWEDHSTYLTRRMTWIATWGIKHDQRASANRFLALLERERKNLERIFRHQ